MLWLLIIPGALVVFIAVLLVRAAAFKPRKTKTPETEEACADVAGAAARLARMIRCKTVSSRDERLVQPEEFDRFRKLLVEMYPNVHKTCDFERIGPSGILYSFKGKNSASPIVFMSHYDVVPADEASWEKPAFEGVIENGVLWGRGTLDTKGTLCAIMETAENLIKTGFLPENDLYFAFAGDEEVAGATAPAMVDELQKRGISPAMVLDEGGAVAQGIFPGVAQPCALIGIAEKCMLDVKLMIEGKGGHASTPPPHTPVGMLAKAVTRIENKPFRAKLTPPVAAMFDTLGRHSSFAYKIVFANIKCFMPVLGAMFKKRGGEMNAMLRTTCAFTMMEGSNASNVLPPSVNMVANLRLIGGETTESAIAYLKATAGDPDIEFREIYGMNPSRDSRADGGMWEALVGAIAQTWPDSIVSPYLMFACSDSRHYCRISDRVYRFSAMALSREERSLIHGHNERITMDQFEKTIQFYTRLMRRC